MSRRLAALLSSAALLALSAAPASAEVGFRGTFGSAGTGVGQFEWASGVAVDGSDRVYVADCLLNRVSIFKPDGTFVGQLGGPFAGGPAPRGSAPREFDCPFELDADGDDYLYVADSWNNRVQSFTGLDTDVPLDYIQSFVLRGTDKLPCAPYDVTVDRWHDIWISGGGRPECHVAAKFDRGGHELLRLGGWGSAPGEFRLYMHVATDADGKLYVSDWANDRVQKFDGGGGHLSEFGRPGPAGGEFRGPHGLTVDPAGNLWVAETGVNGRIQQFTAMNEFAGAFGSLGTGPGEFTMAYDVAADSDCNVYAIDTSGVHAGSERIHVFGQSEAPLCRAATPR